MERETLNFSTSPAEIASSLYLPKKGIRALALHIVTAVSARMLPMLGFGPGKELVVHEFFKEWRRFPSPDASPALSQLRSADGLGLYCSVLVAKTGGLPDTLTLEDELVPIHSTALEYAHFHLLSFGPETDTLQPARYC